MLMAADKLMYIFNGHGLVFPAHGPMKTKGQAEWGLVLQREKEYFLLHRLVPGEAARDILSLALAHMPEDKSVSICFVDDGHKGPKSAAQKLKEEHGYENVEFDQVFHAPGAARRRGVKSRWRSRRGCTTNNIGTFVADLSALS